MPKVLVTDASKGEALAVIRSLGKMGVEVTAGDSFCFNAGFLSRYCKRRILYPSPERSKKRFLKFMLELVRRENFDLIIPVTDFTVIPIAEYKEDFEKYVKVATPSYETALKAYDKANTVRIAAEHGIPHPKTFFIENVEHIRKILGEIKYPVVIKPRMKVMWADDKAIKLKVSRRNYAWNKKDLMDKYMRIASFLEKSGIKNCFPLIQEFVAGDGYGVEVLMHNSKPIALFMHKRLREYPIEGGASTLRESIRIEKLADLGIKLLTALNWEGVAMVEFKLDKSNFKPKLMEVNGRFWGSLPLAISAGVDFPYLLYKIMVENYCTKVFNYKKNIKQRCLIPGDILWLLSSLFFTSDRIDAVRNFIKSFIIPDDIITLDDLAPTIGALVTLFKDYAHVVSKRYTIEGEIIRS
ncbi:MAG: ATP-grasp domain-containing protein [Candidatus Bathyarchaeia archaeon]